MAEHQVLFCPFCRESFEHQTRCPEHELTLVSFAELGPDPTGDDDELDDDEPLHQVPLEDRPIAALDPRWGRGVVALGALINVCALGLRMASHPDTVSLYRLARAFPVLWTPALVSFTVFYILARRRTPRGLRSLRVLVPLLSLLSPLTLGWGLYLFSRDITLGLGPAVYAVAFASLLLLLGGLKLGEAPLSKRA